MATLTFTADDLSALLPNAEREELEVMAQDTLARALLAAPCLASDGLSDMQVMQAKAVIRGAIQRWSMQTTPPVHINAGDFGIGPQGAATNLERKGLFYPTEEDELRKICTGKDRRVTSSWVI